uniref:RMI1_N domain-containing protein n=1 Tax=Rhabditophanes sp. KR3021 TaxID=114890 RepID=A0AC35TI66_9BILA
MTANESEVGVISKYFSEKCHIHLRKDWLEECIERVKLTQMNDEASLKLAIFHQICYADFKEIVEKPDKFPYSARPTTGTIHLILQIESVVDIFKGIHETLLLKKGDASSTIMEMFLQENAEEENKNSKMGKPKKETRRLLKLNLTDGKRPFIGLEHRKVEFLNAYMVPGVKIAVSGKTRMQNNTLMLEPMNCYFLGGCATGGLNVKKENEDHRTSKDIATSDFLADDIHMATALSISQYENDVHMETALENTFASGNDVQMTTAISIKDGSAISKKTPNENDDFWSDAIIYGKPKSNQTDEKNLNVFRIPSLPNSGQRNKRRSIPSSKQTFADDTLEFVPYDSSINSPVKKRNRLVEDSALNIQTSTPLCESKKHKPITLFGDCELSAIKDVSVDELFSSPTMVLYDADGTKATSKSSKSVTYNFSDPNDTIDCHILD